MVSDSPDFLKGNGASYVRVASIAIAAYDYLLTLPAEWRFYKAQRSWRLSAGCILFVLIRYISIITLVISNVGFFGTFSAEACSHYYLAAPVFKVLQTMISQVILGIRTYNISKRSQRVLWTLLILFVLITAMEWFTNLWDRLPAQNDINNCTPANSTRHLSVWLYYVLAMSYDVITLAISTYYLIGWSANLRKMPSLVKLMFYDGLGYFVVLTGANIFNLILYRTSDESYQSSGASVGYTVTWIMSQKILIHLRDAAAEHQVKQIVTRQLHSGADVSRAMRSQFEATTHKDPLDDEFSLKARHTTDRNNHGGLYGDRPEQTNTDAELDVQVQIEHTVTVDYLPAALDRETYRETYRPHRSSRSSRWGPGSLPR
ncbi:unnamed protein product [Somion occarium]|uniref:DUF6533 domain-containing protein n=1 Tax=Somion occarium TaxID=3059160 RepID=A0ABP1DP63_9APHY